MQKGWDGGTKDVGAQRVRRIERWPSVEPAQSVLMNGKQTYWDERSWRR